MANSLSFYMLGHRTWEATLPAVQHVISSFAFRVGQGLKNALKASSIGKSLLRIES